MTELRIRDAVTKIQQESLKLHVQAEHAQAEITRLGGMIGEREVVIKSQKQIIDDLEKSKTRGEQNARLQLHPEGRERPNDGCATEINVD